MRLIQSAYHRVPLTQVLILPRSSPQHDIHNANSAYQQRNGGNCAHAKLYGGKHGGHGAEYGLHAFGGYGESAVVHVVSWIEIELGSEVRVE